MASPVGHSLVGLAFFFGGLKKPVTLENLRADRGPIAAFVLLANLPDADFAISWIITDNPNRYHSAGTHTLLFAASVGMVLGYFFRITPHFFKNALLFGAVVGSHATVDFLTGPVLGWHRSYGVPWLMPFMSERITSPFTLLVGPRHGTWEHLLSAHNWGWALYEVALLLPIVFLVSRRSSRS
jgi:membrane-bound metal-dependent hydrolase YbcI (DUF457 family)